MHTSLSLNITLIETIQQSCAEKKHYKKKKGDYATVSIVVRLHIMKHICWHLSVHDRQIIDILVHFFFVLCVSLLVRGVIHIDPNTDFMYIIFLYSHSDTWWQHYYSLLCRSGSSCAAALQQNVN